MILLQLSSGQGPLECARAVALASQLLIKECHRRNVKVELVEQVPDTNKQCFKSVLLELSGEQAADIGHNWQGVMQWICQSPFRPKHKRKNWFFSCQMFELDEVSFNDKIHFQTCRASGAGGQHVNTTDSAVQATHLESGIMVRVETERSQHANKRLAKLLIMQKLAESQSAQMSQQEKLRWEQHNNLERGNPKKVFKGEQFTQ